MKKMKVWGMLLALVMCTSIAMAQDPVDMTFTGVGNWTDPNLWDVGSVPGSVQPANYVNIMEPNTVCTVNTDTGAFAGGNQRMQVDNGATLVLEEGGVLAANTWSRIGVSGVGTLIQTGGLFEVQNDKLGIGDKDSGTGYYIMSGGTLTHAGDRGDLGVGSRTGTGTFTVIGTVPVIQMEELIVCERDNANGTVEFVLDANGVSPIVLSNTATIDAQGDTTTSALVVRATAVPPMTDILLVDITSENAVVGAFDTVNGNPATEGAQMVVSSGSVENTYTLTYMGGTGNDIVLLYQSSVTKSKIVWVSEWNADPNTGVPYDQGWIDLLRAEGYVVDANTAGNYTELTESKIAELESADMIIISRNSNSGNYATDANEVTQWNSFTAPIIMMTPWIARSNRWEWINSTSIVEYTPETFMDVVAVDNPVFAGVSIEAVDSLNLVDVIDETVDSGQNTFITATDVGNGTLLSRRMDDSSIWIAEWEAGVPCYEGTTQVPAGRRMLFTAGGGGGQTAGSMNLNEDGQRMFLNAVDYMLPAAPVTPTHLYTFEDGTAKDEIDSADGTLIGGAEIIDGAMVTTAQDQWMEMPGDVIAMNTYDAVTIEAWYIPTAGANTSWSMLAYFGDSVNGLGSNGFFITSARGDDKSRAAISIGDIASPWASESGADGPEYDDGLEHYMASTIDGVDITLYIDGELIASTPLSAANQISGISQNYAYLAKGGYDGDPEWIGAIEQFAIYDVALSAKQIAANYAAGPAK
jgi:hypothetical protein